MTVRSQLSLFQSPGRDTSIRVGPAGWNYKDWEGIVYPQHAGKGFDPLAFLADYFDTIEINSSFYHPLKSADAARWVRRVGNNPRFRFTAKAWQRLTHTPAEERIPTLPRDCELVRTSLSPLLESGRLGALLVQFPWSFRFGEENLAHIQNLVRRLQPFPVVVEVRHGSWDREAFYTFLREAGAGFCNVDQPVIGDSLKPSAHVTSPVGYMRLHGRNYENWFKEEAGRDARYDYLYTKMEIGQIADLLKTVKQGTRETYAVTNNHFRGQALVNAAEILEELDAQPPAVPPLLAETYPRLRKK
jgi:uncharacterized protein YecE (DUF72 family)